MKNTSQILAVLAAVTMIGSVVATTTILQAVTAVNPSLTFTFKVKECRVDLPDPVLCKDLKKMLNDGDFTWLLEAHPVGGAFEITLTPEPER